LGIQPLAQSIMGGEKNRFIKRYPILRYDYLENAPVKLLTKKKIT